MSGPLPETTQDRIHTKDIHSISEQKLKFLTPLGIEPGPPGSKAGALLTTPNWSISFKDTNFLISLILICKFQSVPCALGFEVKI